MALKNIEEIYLTMVETLNDFPRVTSMKESDSGKIKSALFQFDNGESYVEIDSHFGKLLSETMCGANVTLSNLGRNNINREIISHYKTPMMFYTKSSLNESDIEQVESLAKKLYESAIDLDNILRSDEIDEIKNRILNLIPEEYLSKEKGFNLF